MLNKKGLSCLILCNHIIISHIPNKWRQNIQKKKVQDSKCEAQVLPSFFEAFDCLSAVPSK